MTTFFKNGVIVKDGVNQGQKTPTKAFQSAGQNTSSGNVPEWASGFVQGAKDIGQDIYDGVSDGAENFASNMRSKFLKKDPEEIGAATQASWAQSSWEDRDWRVRLSLPTHKSAWYDKNSNKILQPLSATNGMTFPYTPTIILSHSANYQQIAPIHNNYPFFAYQNSQVDQLVITGQFYCQNGTEANYWVACLHYLRAVTKMDYGSDKSFNRGAPPPVVKLNGYGDFVFKDVPVIITNFTVDMPNEVDYIATGFGDIDPIALRNGTSVTEQKREDGVGWAPAESQFTVTCQPIYSRDKVTNFSYSDFIKGTNLDKGYI
tara:strand:- start:500 stop:1453 length:954 start_codon:yes stop_codon:yes gene_type:complete